MKLIKKNKQVAFEIATCLLPLFLPLLAPVYFSYILVGWSAYGLIFNFENPRNTKTEVLAPIAYFLVLIVGLTYTEYQNINEGFSTLEKGASLLVIPLVFYLTKIDYNRISLFFFLSFTLGNLIAIIACWFTAITKFSGGASYKVFFYHEFASAIEGHATYLSFYLLFNIAILVYLHRTLYNYRKYYWTAIVFFTITIFSLQARITIIGLIFLFLYYGFKSFKNPFFLLAICLLIIFAVNFAFKSDRFKELVNIPEEGELVGTNYENGITQRIFFWVNGVDLIGNNLPWGVGTGDVSMVLSNNYINLASKVDSPSKKRAMLIYADKELNLHNQYLHTLLQTGIVGFFLLLFPLGLLLYKGIKAKNNLLVILFLLTCLVFLTEVFFSRQKGVVLFSLFYPFLMMFIKNCPYKKENRTT